MTSSTEPQGDAGRYRNEGIRTLLAMFEHGDPEQHQPVGQILHGLREGAFGVFLFVAILPAFIPIPGIGGAVSGPLVLLIGAQMMCGLSRPWVPGFIARRGPKRGTMQRFLGRIDRPLRLLDRLLRPRLPALVCPLPARLFSGVLLLLLGVLLSLPIPFTNYLFGFQLLLFALALIERDGVLMLFNWLAGIAAAAFFGLGSGQLLGQLSTLYQRWSGG
ncbi:membrane protein [Stenotrophomonas daejeonensis]|uniref:Membrane protein n=1 Tax=Stenotrophomonas daejeonensis TaxID=659018 RepID=A0A0R0DNL5_9GAMM|nr:MULTISPECIES: exopolysaccharide biosynthesis protein [Stenotrophomonas]KRG83613.1 membrane protein [Stenotrophomonas daejeonensis]MCG8276081.1 exopolysaccharide biosynthesis protein [Stenotrophomonas sp. NLF4-10]